MFKRQVLARKETSSNRLRCEWQFWYRCQWETQRGSCDWSILWKFERRYTRYVRHRWLLPSIRHTFLQSSPRKIWHIWRWVRAGVCLVLFCLLLVHRSHILPVCPFWSAANRWYFRGWRVITFWCVWQAPYSWSWPERALPAYRWCGSIVSVCENTRSISIVAVKLSMCSWTDAGRRRCGRAAIYWKECYNLWECWLIHRPSRPEWALRWSSLLPCRFIAPIWAILSWRSRRWPWRRRWWCSWDFWCSCGSFSALATRCPSAGRQWDSSSDSLYLHDAWQIHQQ